MNIGTVYMKDGYAYVYLGALMAYIKLHGKVYGSGGQSANTNLFEGGKHCYLKFSVEEFNYVLDNVVARGRNVTLQELICFVYKRKSSVSNRLLFTNREIKGFERNVVISDIEKGLEDGVHAVRIGGKLTYTVMLDKDTKSSILGLEYLSIDFERGYSEEGFNTTGCIPLFEGNIR